jgi:hypothetical protein
MPAPVSFTLSLAPLPANFEGTLQEWAAAVVDRLTVAPAEPWSSFQNGGALGSSDVGPVLVDGTQWYVFDTGLGSYTYHKQNGAGLVNRTVSLEKLSTGAHNCLVWFDNTGTPNALQPGTDGQTLQMVTGTVAWQTPEAAPGATYFEATVGTSQDLDTAGVTSTVNFDTVKNQAGVVFDTANYQVPVKAGEVWFFYCTLQLEDAGAASTDVQISGYIGGTDDIAMVRSYVTAQTRDGFSWSGIKKVTADGFVKVSVVCNETTPANPGLSIANNTGNTRFGGYRIA